MKPIEINDSDFKGGIRILNSHLEEGLEIVKQQKIKAVLIWQELDETRHIVDFNFLKDLDFIETFYFQVKLSKKSNLEGLYSLSKLKKFRWAVDNVFKIDFSRLATLEIVNMLYYDGIALEGLTMLKELYLSSAKTDNLKFLPKLESLELLRIISGKFTSLEGLEHCKNLKKLVLRSCPHLIYADATLQKLEHLESVVFDSCKKNDVNVGMLKSRVPHVAIL